MISRLLGSGEGGFSSGRWADALKSALKQVKIRWDDRTKSGVEALELPEGVLGLFSWDLKEIIWVLGAKNWKGNRFLVSR